MTVIAPFVLHFGGCTLIDVEEGAGNRQFRVQLAWRQLFLEDPLEVIHDAPLRNVIIILME